MEKLGWEGRLYRNAGTPSTPTWTEITDVVQDVTVTVEKELSARVVRDDEWKRGIGRVKTLSVEATLLHVQGDTNLTALRDAFLANDPPNNHIDLAVADGDITTSGTEYWRAICNVGSSGRAEPVGDQMTTPFNFTPAADLDSNEAGITQPTHVTV